MAEESPIVPVVADEPAVEPSTGDKRKADDEPEGDDAPIVELEIEAEEEKPAEAEADAVEVC